MRLKIFDDDYVDEDNIATQLHPVEYIGLTKVHSMRNQMLWDLDYKPEIYPMRVTEDIDLAFLDADIIVSAVDSLEARMEIWPVVYNAGPLWYFDLRMAAEKFTMYLVHASDADWYSRVLEGQKDLVIPPEPCTQKATIYTAFFAGAWAGLMLRRIAARLPIPRMIEHNILDMRVSMLSGSASNQE